MKRKLSTVIISLALIGISSTVSSAETKTQSTFQLPGNQWRIGLDTIAAGRLNRSSNGAPKYLFGLTAGIGAGFRFYFTINDELQTIHPYVEAGTNSLIYPYIGGGIEYDLPVGDDITGNNGAFSIGGGIYLFSRFYGAETLLTPTISISYSFK